MPTSMSIVPELEITSIGLEFEDVDDDLYCSIHDLLMEDDYDDNRNEIVPILIPDHVDASVPMGLGNVDNNDDAIMSLDYMEELYPLHGPMSLENNDEFDMMLGQEDDGAYAPIIFVFETSDDDQPTVAVGASMASIEAMPRVIITDERIECCICLESFEVRGEAKEMPCKHKFHSQCIENWLYRRASCPLCRLTWKKR